MQEKGRLKRPLEKLNRGIRDGCHSFIVNKKGEKESVGNDEEEADDNLMPGKLLQEGGVNLSWPWANFPPESS